MPQRTIRFRTTTPVPARAPIDPGALLARFDAIREQLHVPGPFPDEALAEADAAVAALVLPDRDETSVPFVTIDPVGSTDLDQALHIERAGDGYRVRYAIADVPAFVRPGGAVDAETRLRVETIYAPDQRSPLHPPAISEDAGSLLPDEVRPAFVWDLSLDANGDERGAEVYLARVRSRARLDYGGVQRAVDDGSADEVLMLLAEVGEKRIALEAARGGASLPLPEQEVTQSADGGFVLGFRPPVPAEDWNAQISLMTGMAAAQLMLRGRVGVLRTMPPPGEGSVARFRRQARALGVDWPTSERYGDFIRRLDLRDPRQLALVHEATSLFRGAGYTVFDGDLPEQQVHAAVAAPYAHVTAPLRRLVDRFGLLVCAALTASEPVPPWVLEALPTLPGVMKAGDQRAKAVERACTDAVEAAMMAAHVGETFTADVVDVDPKRSRVTVQLSDPAIVGTAHGVVKLGRNVQVRVDAADVATGTVTMSVL